MYQYQLLLSCFKLVCTCKFLCILSMAALTKPFFRDVLIQKLGWFIWNIWCVGHFDKTPFMQCLSRALRDENPKFLMAASTLLLPFQPLMVSAIHTGIMEVSFAKRASIEPELKMAHNLHKMSSLLGGALFIADDVFPQTSYLHAAWHLAAALGVSTCNKLLEWQCRWNEYRTSFDLAGAAVINKQFIAILSKCQH